jgi:hypothetical protein
MERANKTYPFFPFQKLYVYLIPPHDPPPPPHPPTPTIDSQLTTSDTQQTDNKHRHRHPTIISQPSITDTWWPSQQLGKIHTTNRTNDRKKQTWIKIKMWQISIKSLYFICFEINKIIIIFFPWAQSWSWQRQKDSAITFLSWIMRHYRL